MFGGSEFKPMGQESGGGDQQPPQEPTQLISGQKPGTTMETQGPAEPITHGKPPIGPPKTGLGPLTPMSDPWGMPPKEGVPTGTTPVPETPAPGPVTVPPAAGPIGVPGAGPSSDDHPKPADYKPEPQYSDSPGVPTDVPTNVPTEMAGVDVPQSPKDMLLDRFLNSMSESAGLAKEELAGQLQGIENASYDQMAKMAQMMAMRGIGTSGVAGAGLGNVAASTLQAMIDLKYEHSKLALQERIEQSKMFASLYGHTLSEENRVDLFNQMREWEREQWELSNKQKAESDVATKQNNWAALLGATDGYDDTANAWVSWALTEGGFKDDQVLANLAMVNGKVVVRDPLLGGYNPYSGSEEQSQYIQYYDKYQEEKSSDPAFAAWLEDNQDVASQWWSMATPAEPPPGMDPSAYMALSPAYRKYLWWKHEQENPKTLHGYSINSARGSSPAGFGSWDDKDKSW